MRRKLPKGVISKALSNRDDWLLARRKDVTASTIAALFGVHEYSSPYELYALKSGKTPEPDLDNSALERGELLEPVAVELMRRHRPRWKIQHNTGKKTRYFRAPEYRLGATPDTLISCPDRGPGTVQIKSVEKSVFRRKWAPGDTDPEPPLWIVMQATLEAYMTGSRWACVAPLVVGYGLEMPIIEIPILDEVIDAMKSKSLEFWAMIEAGEDPDPDFSRDQELIDRMYAVGTDDEIDLVSNRRAYELVELHSIVRDRRDAAAGELSEIEAEIKHIMGKASLAYLPGGMRMTWRTTRKKHPDGTVTAFRVLRVPRPPEIVLTHPSGPAKPVNDDRKLLEEDWKF